MLRLALWAKQMRTSVYWRCIGIICFWRQIVESCVLFDTNHKLLSIEGQKCCIPSAGPFAVHLGE